MPKTLLTLLQKKYMKYKLYVFACSLLLVLAGVHSHAQEINAKVTVLSNRIPTTVDKKIFTTLQNQLTNLLNNRKWTGDNFKPNEKIEVNILINLASIVEANVYKADLTIQAARPVFNTDYNSPLINWQDNDFSFRYVEFQPIEFNENRVAGTDAQASNLTAVLGYYMFMVLGFDYDSFSQGSGDPYFKKALYVVNNAPQGRNISGWTQFDGLRNRYWLADNLINSRFTIFHDIIYQYYRQCLDVYYENEQQAREALLNILNLLNTFNTENPNTMVLQFFMQSKSEEIIQMLKKGTPDQKSRAVEILPKVDVTNAGKYRQEIK